jgi:hypothetical protein
MKEGILFETYVDEHGFEALLDVADAAFINAADDVLSAGAFDGVFLQHSVLDHGDALLEFFGVHNDANAFVEAARASK